MAYNFINDVTVTVGGRVITGLADDGVSYGKTEDNIEMNVGAQGEVLTNIHHNPTGQVTIRLKANSPSIQYLNQLANSNRASTVSVRRAGSVVEVVSGTKGYVTRPAEAGFGRNAADREFTIMVEDYQQN